YMNLAYVYATEGRDTELNDLLDAADRHGVFEGMSRDDLGVWYLQIGLSDRGSEMLRETRDPLMRVQFARTLAEGGQVNPAEMDEWGAVVDGAAARLDAAAAARLYNELGSLHADLGDLDEAFRQYKRAIERDPDYAGSHNNIALIHEAQKR